jgi:hypothetical protein
VIIAFDVSSLVRVAERNGFVVQLVPQAGDFVPAEAELFRICGGGTEIPDQRMREAIASGAERTMEQDPAFAFRIIVDIAENALSPAINDPTTGVLSIDQIQFLLQEVGKRDLNTGNICDDSGPFAWFTVRPTGRISPCSVPQKFASTVRTAYKSCGACVRCWKIQLAFFHLNAPRTFASNSTCSTSPGSNNPCIPQTASRPKSRVRRA